VPWRVPVPGHATLTVLAYWCRAHTTAFRHGRKRSDGSAREYPPNRPHPHCRGSDRLADASTVRRWFWRLTRSPRFLAGAPTLFAWDWRTAGRIPIREANLTMMNPDRDVLQPRLRCWIIFNKHGWKIRSRQRTGRGRRILPAASRKPALVLCQAPRLTPLALGGTMPGVRAGRRRRPGTTE
jgi:hypothetical protein